MQVQGLLNFLTLKLSVKGHRTDLLTSVYIWSFITVETSVQIFVSSPVVLSVHSSVGG